MAPPRAFQRRRPKAEKGRPVPDSSVRFACGYTPPASVNDLPRLGAYLALFSEIGIVLFVTTLGGALAGHWLDQQLGTNPLFVLVGFLGGASVGAVADYRLISRFLARLN